MFKVWLLRIRILKIGHIYCGSVPQCLYFWYDLIGQATGALNDSCQDRSSPVENTVMDDEYEDVAQHFQDIVKW